MIGDMFHCAFVVPDIDESLTDLGSTFGVEWSEIRNGSTPVWTPDGFMQLTLRGCFSVGSGNRIEVIEGQPGTPWEPQAAPVLHHVGFWSTDLVQDTAWMLSNGYVLAATAWGEDAPAPHHFAYGRKAGGPYMELLDAASRESYEEWWSKAGGA